MLHFGLYLYWRFERCWVCVVCQAFPVALFFNTQQDLNILAVLVAAGLLITLHPRLDLILPQRGVLCWLHLWSCTLEGKRVQLLLVVQVLDDTLKNSMGRYCEFTFTLEDFLDPSLKAYSKSNEKILNQFNHIDVNNDFLLQFNESNLTFFARAEDAGGSFSPLFLRFLSACLLPRRPVVRVMVGVCWKVE